MMCSDVRWLSVSVLVLLVCLPAWSEVFRYVDGSGNEHYVTSLEQVPETYRSQVAAPHVLPPINKFQSRSVTGDERSKAVKRHRVELFVTNWCPYCKKAEAFLRDNGISYVRRNIENDSNARQKHLALGGGGVPVLKVGTEVVRGFNDLQFRQVLGLQ
ncbi:MAG: glutaredoxin family protein [Bdellovibrionales bacterium]|nr:glutaredoxin family protein [Bdellovibrionales bacterium]